MLRYASLSKHKQIMSDIQVQKRNGSSQTLDAAKLRKRIDYVFYHAAEGHAAEGLRVDRAEVLPSTASDHLPLLVRFAR